MYSQYRQVFHLTSNNSIPNNYRLKYFEHYLFVLLWRLKPFVNKANYN